MSAGPILVQAWGSRAKDLHQLLFYFIFFYFLFLGYMANIMGNKRKENLMGVLKHGTPTEVDIPKFKMPPQIVEGKLHFV